MSKELELIQLLVNRTIDGQVTWEPTAREDEFLTVVVGEISVLIAQLPSTDRDDPSPDLLLTVKDKNDLEIFSIRNGLNDVKWKDLESLYEIARRAALNIEKTLDTLLKHLREESH